MDKFLYLRGYTTPIRDKAMSEKIVTIFSEYLRNIPTLFVIVERAHYSSIMNRIIKQLKESGFKVEKSEEDYAVIDVDKELEFI